MKVRTWAVALTFLWLSLGVGAVWAEGPEKDLRLRAQQRHLARMLQMAEMDPEVPPATKAQLLFRLKEVKRQQRRDHASYMEENPQDLLNYPVDRLGQAELP